MISSGLLVSKFVSVEILVSDRVESQVHGGYISFGNMHKLSKAHFFHL